MPDELPVWIHSGVCRAENMDPDVFFPSDSAGVTRAKLHCNRCPVRDTCLEHALANNETIGVWGGASERERARIAARRRRLVTAA